MWSTKVNNFFSGKRGVVLQYLLPGDKLRLCERIFRNAGVFLSV